MRLSNVTPVDLSDNDSASTASHLHFTIGQDESGQWLALEAHGRMGGLFKSQADAVHFAILECGRQNGAFDLSPTPLCLQFSACLAP